MGLGGASSSTVLCPLRAGARGARLPLVIIPSRPPAFLRDPSKVETFLETLAAVGTLRAAAESIGICAGTARIARRREVAGRPNPAYHAEFDAACEQALQDFADLLKSEARRKAVEGWVEREVFDKDGNKLGDVRKFSDRMHELLLKRHDPEFRERHEHSVRAQVDAQVTTLPMERLREMSPRARGLLRELLLELRAEEAQPVEARALPTGESSDPHG